VEFVIQHGPGALEDKTVSDRRDDQRTTHDKGKRWVPGPEEIKKVQHLGRVDHA
jgi:hypothetical protein